MKRTLLDMTQGILSSLESDEVNSIQDSTEARQVADIIRSTYFDMCARYDLLEHTQLIHLNPSGDATKPVLMSVPDGVSKIEWIQYRDTADTYPSFKNVRILPNYEFLDMVNSLNPSETWVDSFTFTTENVATTVTNSFTFNYRNEKQPEYCTVLENEYVVFDSFDSDEDATLQSDKTLCNAIVTPTFELIDAYIPVMNERLFPLLFNEAKALAFLELKQMSHPKAEREINRQQSNLQRIKAVVDKPSHFDQLPNFGRNR